MVRNIDNAISKQERLENTLLDFIERVSKEPSMDKEVEVLPSMVQALITLWDIC